jgi:hypothetical protein
MSDNEPTTTQEIESYPETKHRKSSREIFASFIIYLFGGMIVMAIILLIYIYG